MVHRQFTRFVFTGFVNTLFYFLLYSLLIFVHIDYRFAVLGAMIPGVLFSYWTFERFVFGGGSKRALGRFVLLYIFLYVGNIGLIAWMRHWMRNDYLNGAVATICCALASFVLNKIYVYQTDNGEADGM